MTRVLVADDNPQFAEVLREMLERAGYDVQTAYSGLAAVAAVARGGVDVAVLDVLMPGLSGDAIVEVEPGLPVVLMTGASGGQFLRAQRVPVLRKPFTEEQLLVEIQRVLERSTPRR